MQIRYKFNQKNNKVWFVSDLHAKHGKDFILTPRGYKTADEAYSDIYKQWNAVVAPEDVVFNLGDIIVGAGTESVPVANELINGLNGKIFFIWGNHNAGVKSIYRDALRQQYNLDSNEVELYPLSINNEKFNFLSDYVEIIVDNQLIVLTHYPIASWNEMKESWNIHGHCHRNLPEDNTLRRIDVGWDYKNRPVSFNEIKTVMNQVVPKAVDHHGR